jgi:hypothetical protein
MERGQTLYANAAMDAAPGVNAAAAAAREYYAAAVERTPGLLQGSHTPLPPPSRRCGMLGVVV